MLAKDDAVVVGAAILGALERQSGLLVDQLQALHASMHAGQAPDRGDTAAIVAHLEEMAQLAGRLLLCATVLLTAQERAVLAASAKGLGSADVAQLLGQPLEAVRRHLASAIEELGARSKLEAVIMALRLGIATLPQEDDDRSLQEVRPPNRVHRGPSGPSRSG